MEANHVKHGTKSQAFKVLRGWISRWTNYWLGITHKAAPIGHGMTPI